MPSTFWYPSVTVQLTTYELCGKGLSPSGLVSVKKFFGYRLYFIPSWDPRAALPLSIDGPSNPIDGPLTWSPALLRWAIDGTMLSSHRRAIAMLVWVPKSSLRAQFLAKGIMYGWYEIVIKMSQNIVFFLVISLHYNLITPKL